MSSYKFNELRQRMVDVGRWLYDRELIVAGEGNLSCLLDDGTILTTPSGKCKGRMVKEDLVLVDRLGKLLGGKHQPSSELAMHLAIYNVRPDVRAVVHAHPPVCSGYAVAGIPLDKALIAEVVVMLGCIPLAPYATPTTGELAASVVPLIRSYDALLLSNHGAVTVGADIEGAFDKMEIIEHFAKIALVGRVLGGEREIPRDKLGELAALRDRFGIGGGPICALEGTPGEDAGDEPITLRRAELASIISKILTRYRP